MYTWIISMHDQDKGVVITYVCQWSWNGGNSSTIYRIYTSTYIHTYIHTYIQMDRQTDRTRTPPHPTHTSFLNSTSVKLNYCRDLHYCRRPSLQDGSKASTLLRIIRAEEQFLTSSPTSVLFGATCTFNYPRVQAVWLLVMVRMYTLCTWLSRLICGNRAGMLAALGLQPT